MNRLSGYNIISQLANTGVDPYEGVEALRSEVDMHRLQIALKLPLALIRETLIPDTLQSISSPHFRYCSKCIFRGYHGIIHQFETIRRCPVHGDKLKVVCDFCGTKAPYRLNLNLLATPYRCGSCGRLYSSCLPSILHTRPLKLKDRIAITRLRLSHGSSY